jgi:hypothetical protein
MMYNAHTKKLHLLVVRTVVQQIDPIEVICQMRICTAPFALLLNMPPFRLWHSTSDSDGSVTKNGAVLPMRKVRSALRE